MKRLYRLTVSVAETYNLIAFVEAECAADAALAYYTGNEAAIRAEVREDAFSACASSRIDREVVDATVCSTRELCRALDASK